MDKYKWQIKGYSNLKVNEKGQIFNNKTKRFKKLCLNGYSAGIWVTSKKFLTNPKKHLELNTVIEPINNFEKQLSKYQKQKKML